MSKDKSKEREKCRDDKEDSLTGGVYCICVYSLLLEKQTNSCYWIIYKDINKGPVRSEVLISLAAIFPARTLFNEV